MPTLFCNIAWMKHYDGRAASDGPVGGGAYVAIEGQGGEECNFVACDDGFVYGYFPSGKGDDDRQVKIQRLGADRKADFVDGIDVVWTAPFEGNDPRTVVGWYRNARVYRDRQNFHGDYPSRRHERDGIDTYHVRARREDVVLLDGDRRMRLGRGKGWSGQASWWYADDTANTDARKFVRAVRRAIGGGPIGHHQHRVGPRPHHRAGRASADAHTRYLDKFEVKVSPRHNTLQTRFERFLADTYPRHELLRCHRDDLRYDDGRGARVMVEVKPCEVASVRFAIRAAMGQLLDYRQHQRWEGKQLIVVETAVDNADDRALAHENGFGLAWPDDDGGFVMTWPRKG